MLTAISTIVALSFLLIALLWLGQRRLIFFPDRQLVDPPDDVSVVEVASGDGIAHRLWVVDSAETAAMARVVVFNGNAGNKGHRLPLARSLATRGFDVILFDYRGYGDTEGAPTEEGLLRDGLAVVTASFQGELPLVYFGESIGAAVATSVAIEHPPQALILRSPFSSLADMAGTHYPLLPSRLLLRDRFPVGEVIGTVDAPILVILGTGDSIVPADLSRRVFEAALEPKELVELEGYDHNDPGLSHGEALVEAVSAFLEQVLE